MTGSAKPLFFPACLLARLVETLLSRRGLAIAFLVLAGLLAVSGWLRPPLSSDIRGLHLSLGLVSGTAAEDILHGPRRVPVDSAGVVLLALLGVGSLFVLLKPDALSLIAGLLLVVAVAANAAVVFNHPVLIERMDWEYEQRQQMVAILNATPGEQPLTTTRNGRTSVLLGSPSADEQRGDPVRGWVYLLYGRWLILWAVMGVLLSSRGGMARRLGLLGVWAVVGTGLAALVCLPRLIAEYDWVEAQQLEGRCNFAAARQELASAVRAFPQLEELERTWLFAGKLDEQEKKPTAQAAFFRAYQLARDRGQPRSVAFPEDLPWLIAGTTDYRKGSVTPPIGFDLVGNPPTETDAAGAPDYSEGAARSHGRFHHAYLVARPLEHRAARAVMEAPALLAETAQPAVRRQTARLWIDEGVTDYLRQPVLTDAGLDYSRRERALTAADAAWERAARLGPSQLDYRLYLGLARSQLDPTHPDLAESEWSPLLSKLADRAILADLLDQLGSAELTAGDAAAARRHFAESFDRLNLPRKKNYRAQKGLGGL